MWDSDQPFRLACQIMTSFGFMAQREVSRDGQFLVVRSRMIQVKLPPQTRAEPIIVPKRLGVFIFKFKSTKRHIE